VKEEGDILFVAECLEGVGNTTFSEAMKNFRGRPRDLGMMLVEKFDMPSYVAFRALDCLKRFKVTLASDFSKSDTESLGFDYTDNMDDYAKNLKGKGYVIPFAENILPVIQG